MQDQLYFYMKDEACFSLRFKNKAKPGAIAPGQLFLTLVFLVRLATRAQRGWQPGIPAFSDMGIHVATP